MGNTRHFYPVPQNAPHVSAGINDLDFPEWPHPKATDISPWYRVYTGIGSANQAAGAFCFFVVSLSGMVELHDRRSAR